MSSLLRGVAKFHLLLLLFLTAACGTQPPGALLTPTPSAPAPRLQVSRHAPSGSSTPSPITRTSAPAQTSSPSLQTPAPQATALTPAPSLPKEYYIRGILGHKQFFPLGCEAAVAKDWANFFDKDFNEFEFQYKLPVSDNPDFGFVGSVDSPWGQVPPYGYGVHAGPVADLLNAYGIPAKAYKGYTLEQVKAQVALDKPVIAWVIGNVVGGFPSTYKDSQGRTTIVAAYEHVVIVTGYNPTHIRYMNNGKFYESPNLIFLNSWGILGNMVIVAP